MKILYFSVIVIILLSPFTFNLISAQATSGPVLFMKSNSIGKIYANFTFPVLNNKTWNLTEGILSPGIYPGINEPPIPIDSKNITIVAKPNSLTGNKNNVTVTYTITAKNDTKGVYALFLYFCGLSPLVVGLNESEVNPMILDKFFTSQYNCPAMDEYTPEMKIVGYSDMISKIVSVNSSAIDRLADVPVPEFPFTIPILLISVVSVIVFYRVQFRK